MKKKESPKWRDRFREWGLKGGETTKIRKGTDHYKKISRKGVKARLKKKSK